MCASYSPPAGDKPMLIDYVRLRSFTGSDVEAERDILDLFRSTAEQLLERLDAALDDSERWARECHSLKGASLNLGVMKLGKLAEAAEASPPSKRRLSQLKSAFAETVHLLP